jgi:hypothetical protein
MGNELPLVLESARHAGRDIDLFSRSLSGLASERNLASMVRFAKVYPDVGILQSLNILSGQVFRTICEP